MVYYMNLVQPIIPRRESYVVSHKALSVHSVDRDITKWPNSNHFAVNVPYTIKNVTSMALVNSIFPSNQKVISTANENTKMTVTCDSVKHPIEIDEGTYTTARLTNELKNKLATVDSDFDVLYNEVSQKFVFYNTKHQFTFHFSSAEEYERCDRDSPLYKNHSGWGLGYTLGFNNKQDYVVSTTSDISIHSVDSVVTDSGVYVLNADVNPRLFVDSSIYMEIKQYNHYDEMIPFSETNNTTLTSANRATVYTRNDGVGGTTDSAFAKIQMVQQPLSLSVQDFTNNKCNIARFIDPVNRLSRLEFKFRYHNGRMVDFQDQPFEFTIEITHLIDDIQTPYTIRTT
jgi:hypothetical protein